jgi:hypothetical protein
MSFGIFDTLADYGILGFAVLALGYLCWMFLNRLIQSEDDLKARIKELENDVQNTLKESTESSKSLKETVLMLFGKR